MVAYFMEYKDTFSNIEEAMDWIASHASRFGMSGPEAEAKGWAQVF